MVLIYTKLRQISFKYVISQFKRNQWTMPLISLIVGFKKTALYCLNVSALRHVITSEHAHVLTMQSSGLRSRRFMTIERVTSLAAA